MTIEKRVSEENSFDVTNLAGDEGFEPPNGGTRTHCLTTWRIPIRIDILYHKNPEKTTYILYMLLFTPQRFDWIFLWSRASRNQAANQS